jgi:hypothetical protein
MAPDGPLVPGHANFGTDGIIKSETKLDPIIGDGTISAVTRPLDILFMCLISDVEV